VSGHCVIIGAGHGAAQLCASLRQERWEGPVTLIGAEPFLPYHRPPLSKTQLDPDGDTTLQLIRPKEFYACHQIDTKLGVRVSAIDRGRKTVKTDAGETAYDKLVLCLGSLHRRPPIDGIAHGKVFVLQTAAHAEQLRHAAKPGSRAVIIGGGFIGLEVAASLRQRGLDVTVLELAPRVLSRVTSPEVSGYFENLHRSHGVSLHTGVSVTGIEDCGSGLKVLAAEGPEYAADFVVLGAGAVANTALAETAGLETANGILVDEFNRTSAPDIYALGDCCNQFRPLYQQRMRLESVQNAVDQARTVAASLAGKAVPHDALPWFWSDQYDSKLQIAGVSTGYDHVIVRGATEPGGDFSAWYYRGEKLLAVDAVNDSLAYAVGTKLLKAGLHPAPEDVANRNLETKQLHTKAKERTDA
jgi:3-phenylpropionate/trans-cinnamate dioxygenase ferredoxin reductase subunit